MRYNAHDDMLTAVATSILHTLPRDYVTSEWGPGDSLAYLANAMPTSFFLDQTLFRATMRRAFELGLCLIDGALTRDQDQTEREFYDEVARLRGLA